MTIKQKYPRTYHLEWSPGMQSDDKRLESLEFFLGKEIVATEKMDGENTTIAKPYYHARSLDSAFNWTRSWIAKMQSVISHELDDNIKLVGENLFAKHAIHYPDGYLDGYFYLFSVWEDLKDGTDFCLNYNEVEFYAEMLDLPMPKVFYRGIFDEVALRKIAKDLDTGIIEGYVIRTVEGFRREDFSKHVAKYVRANHVQPDSKHWLANAEQNGKLKEKVKPFYMG